MKNSIQLEIGKALKNKLFLFVVVIGCAITIQSLFYNLEIYQTDMARAKMIVEDWHSRKFCVKAVSQWTEKQL